MFKTGRTSRQLKTVVVAAALFLSAACLPVGAEVATDLGTIEPGVVTIAIQSYPPYTDLRGGKLTGLDIDILNVIADRLGLEVKAEVTDFATMIAGVQARRFDMSVGGVAWTPDRQLGVHRAAVLLPVRARRRVR